MWQKVKWKSGKENDIEKIFKIKNRKENEGGLVKKWKKNRIRLDDIYCFC